MSEAAPAHRHHVPEPDFRSFDALRRERPQTRDNVQASYAALFEAPDETGVTPSERLAVASFVAPRCRSLTCVDVSDKMIAAAKARLSAHPGVAARIADAEDLPFPAGLRA